jgi:hypothetical protein
MIADESIHKLAVEKQCRASFFTFVSISLLISSSMAIAAPSTSTLSCGSWVTDKDKLCVEVQKIIEPTAERTKPKTSPEIKNNFDEADALFGKRTAFNKKKKAKKPARSASILPKDFEKTPTPASPIPIPYPNIAITREKKKPVNEK